MVRFTKPDFRKCLQESKRCGKRKNIGWLNFEVCFYDCPGAPLEGCSVCMHHLMWSMYIFKDKLLLVKGKFSVFCQKLYEWSRVPEHPLKRVQKNRTEKSVKNTNKKFLRLCHLENSNHLKLVYTDLVQAHSSQLLVLDIYPR